MAVGKRSTCPLPTPRRPRRPPEATKASTPCPHPAPVTRDGAPFARRQSAGHVEWRRMGEAHIHPLDRVDDEDVPRWERLFVRHLREDLRTIADLAVGEREPDGRAFNALPADIDDAAGLVTTVLSTQ